jgi:hypothetical protein
VALSSYEVILPPQNDSKQRKETAVRIPEFPWSIVFALLVSVVVCVALRFEVHVELASSDKGLDLIVEVSFACGSLRALDITRTLALLR